MEITGQPPSRGCGFGFQAMNLLEPLMDIPYFLSPGWLRVDPTFAPLRKLPRIQGLVAPDTVSPS
jgi:hypothetical protein